MLDIHLQLHPLHIFISINLFFSFSSFFPLRPSLPRRERGLELKGALRVHNEKRERKRVMAEADGWEAQIFNLYGKEGVILLIG